MLEVFQELNSREIRKWIERNIIYLYGRPRQIRTDQGSEFKGQVEEVCRAFAITHVTTPAFALWQNGRAERMIRFIKSLLSRLKVEDPEI